MSIDTARLDIARGRTYISSMVTGIGVALQDLRTALLHKLADLGMSYPYDTSWCE